MENHLSYEGHTYGRNNGGWFNLTQQQNPFSTLNMKAGGIGDSIASRATTMVGGLIGNAISGGLESGAGNVLSGLGDIASAIPVYGKFAGPALKVLAGGANALIGTSVDAAKKASNDAGINYYNSYAGNATSTDDVRSLTAQANYQDAYKGGVLKKGWASRKNGIAQMHFNDAKSFAQRSQDNNADNILQDQISSGLATYSAYGGPLNMINNDNMGAIEYGFMSDWLANKKAKEDRLKDNANSLIGEPLSTLFADGGKIEIKHPGRLTALKKRTGKTEAELWAEGKPEVRKMITFARNSRKWKKAYGGYLDSVGKLNDTLFALGGDLQSHGSDWSNGASYIGAGFSHEMNPNGGVQVGVDSQGTPNLVEQDEIIYDDYVYSNRIPIDAITKEKFHIGKKKDMTYADLARKLGKEIEERPNDPISKAGYRSQMLALQEEQERQKQEMEAERAREAFASLSPEEQTAVMQQVAQQEQMAQEQAVQEQAMAEQAQMEQAEPQQSVEEEMYAPEEMGYMPEEVPIEEMPEGGYAEGGNLYADGGALEWLKKNHPEIGNKEDIASAMEQRKKAGNVGYAAAFEFITKGENNILSPYVDDARSREHYQELLSYGMNPKVAFGLSYPMPSELKKSAKYNTDPEEQRRYALYKKQVAHRNELWKNMMDSDYSKWASSNKDSNKVYKALDGNRYNTREEAYEANKVYLRNQNKQSPTTNTTAASNTNIKKTAAGYQALDGKTYNTKEKAIVASNIYLRNQDKELSTQQMEGIPAQTEQVNYMAEVPVPRRSSTGSRGRGYTPRASVPSSSPVVGSTPASSPIVQQPVVSTPVVTPVSSSVATSPAGDIVINPLTGEPDFIPTEGLVQNNTVYANNDFAADKAAGYPTADPSSYSSEYSSTKSETATGKEEEKKNEKVPFVTSKESRLRYIPAIGGAVGLAYDLLHQPDYSRADAIINASSDMTPRMIQPSYLGDYLTYRPMDIWAEQNRMDANARATDRAIRNSNSPSRMAGLLSSGYNSLLADGELYKKALEYNNALRERTAAFNRGTNQYNSQVNMTAQQANQNAAMAARRYGLQGLIQGNQMKEAIDARRSASISANLGNLLQSLGNIGEEAYDMDRLKWLEATDVLRSKVLGNQDKYGGMLTKKSKKGGRY